MQTKVYVRRLKASTFCENILEHFEFALLRQRLESQVLHCLVFILRVPLRPIYLKRLSGTLKLSTACHRSKQWHLSENTI